MRRVLEAAYGSRWSASSLALLALGTRLYVSGADELPSPRAASCCTWPAATTRRSSPSFQRAPRAAPPPGSAGPPSARALARVQLCLQLLPEGPGADEVFALLRREVLRTVCERPGPAVRAQVARLLARTRAASPTALTACSSASSLRCLGRFRCPAEGEEGAVEFLEQAQQVSGLLAQLWRAACRHPALPQGAVRRYLLHRCVCPGAAVGPVRAVFCVARPLGGGVCTGVCGDVPLLSRPLLSSCGWRWGPDPVVRSSGQGSRGRGVSESTGRGMVIMLRVR